MHVITGHKFYSALLLTLTLNPALEPGAPLTLIEEFPYPMILAPHSVLETGREHS